jgi:hypothetical protein
MLAFSNLRTSKPPQIEMLNVPSRCFFTHHFIRKLTQCHNEILVDVESKAATVVRVTEEKRDLLAS